MRDPAASLSLFPVEFTLGELLFTVPETPAARWLEILLANDLMLIATAAPEGLIDDDQAVQIESMLLDGAVDVPELRACLQDVVTAVAGRDWWEAVGLVHVFAVEANWDRLHGQVVAAGLDLAATPFAAWLDLAMFLATQHMDEKQLGRFLGILRTPPVGWVWMRSARGRLSLPC